jgi:hypothetical protein
MHGHFTCPEKRQILEHLKQIQIYKNAILKFRLNDTYGDVYNAIFDVVLNHEVGQRNYTTKLQSDYSTWRSNTAQISTLQDNTTNAV